MAGSDPGSMLGAGKPPTAAGERRWFQTRLARGLAVTVALLALAGALNALAPDAGVTSLVGVILVLWLIGAGLLGARWLWRKLTYRVGVRLFFSYLLIGLTPFALCGVFALLVGYVFVGQFGAVRVGEEVEREEARLGSIANGALIELGAHGIAAARTVLANPRIGAGSGALHAEWLLVDGASTWKSAEVPGLEVPSWAPVGEWRGPVVIGERAFLAVVERSGDRMAVAVAPLDIPNARALGAGNWFDPRFILAGPRGAVKAGPKGVTISVGAEREERGKGVQINGRMVPPEQVEPGWIGSHRKPGPLLSRIRLLWFWKSKPIRLWEDGSEGKGWNLLTLIQVQVVDAVRDFFGSSKGLGTEVKTMFGVAGIVFGVMYLIATAFAVVMILTITRSTARLTRGAREVARGNLAHRIKVKRRDQLGDLAISFNAMAESVGHMLDEVAEKERLAREMELAREIQESLLPRRQFNHEGLAVVAHFRPATEVGGDYFDLFPLPGGRLVVAVGDVAGHGLSTGLLMAMVKSAVAALIQEGHRGRELLVRLNALLGQHPVRHRMVTLALVEIDRVAERVEITNGGHPPVYLLSPGGAIEEVLLSALPLGHRWPAPPQSRTLPFPRGSGLLVYSDGLVEATNAAGEPFGYDRLRAALEGEHARDPQAMLATVLAALDAFTAGTPLADDLTVLAIGSGKPATAADGTPT